ncbi:multidrug effflux MFS transporter [Alishewanella tabrizica]|uniref:Bcr/CflA family efflux transporter n=1 Tax=Alishewanella tabrizica TaxID=671278 RepID=A0ABQ2WLC6_9ALTE|nr:multidrug effflux MFS transporter [Alishewanella tabrizica]GGW61070.1 Bcr/CflA family drug resistance efflux transporter [Alishewanella tabrizica]
MQENRPSLSLIALLAAVIAITPLAIDMYLPAMQIMVSDLDTTMALVQQSLSIYLAAYAVGMLLFGPLADMLGRRPLALAGLIGFLISSVLLSIVNSIEGFLFWRAAQAFCGAAATVVIPGIVRHLYQQHTAKGMSYVSMIMMLAPLIAPAVGSGIMYIGHWQVIFDVLAGYALIVLLLSWRFMPEVPRDTSVVKPAFFSGYQQVFANKAAWPHIATSMFASFSFFTFLTAVSFVYISYYGVSEQLFALLFGLNVSALILANFLNSRLVTRKGPQFMLNAGLVLAVVCATLLSTFSYFELGLWFTVFTIAPLMASLGLVATNADAMILMKFPDHTGTATAVIGTLRFGVGALAGPLLGVFYTGTALPFSLLMLTGALLIVLAQLARRYRQRQQ